jgi:hypothetical protein
MRPSLPAVFHLTVGQDPHVAEGCAGALPTVVPDWLLEGGEEIPTAMGPARGDADARSFGGTYLSVLARSEVTLRRRPYDRDHHAQHRVDAGAGHARRVSDSLSPVEALDVDWVVSSHGSPFRNHRGWIEATRRHHVERCEEIVRHIRSEASDGGGIGARRVEQRTSLRSTSTSRYLRCWRTWNIWCAPGGFRSRRMAKARGDGIPRSRERRSRISRRPAG